MFITEAIAATETAATVNAAPVSGFITQLILVFAIFYFILIRPQQKKMREHEKMLDAIKIGDEIITNGGIYARVAKATADTLMVKVAEGVEIKISRSSVREVVSDTKTGK